MALELEVYGLADPTTKLDVLPYRQDPAFLEELNGPGGGSFKISPETAKLLEQANLIDYGNIIKCRITETQQVVSAFEIQAKNEVIVDSGEASSKLIAVSGEGLRTWLHNAVVYPMGGYNQYAADTRVFSFASEQGSWYVPANWVAPVNLYKYLQSGSTWGTAPANWPDEPNAYWIWDRSVATINTFPAGTVYFRREFTLASTTSLSLFIAADNNYNAYIDAQQVVSQQGAQAANYQQTQRYDVTLGPGNHVLAVEVANTAVGPAGLIAAMRSNGSPAVPTAATTLFKTGDASGWKILPYPTVAPGWTTGAMLLKLLSEAEARGVDFAALVQPTFTDTLDSAGNPWADATTWTFDVGAEYSDVIDKIEELNADIWIDPDTYELNAVKQRGTDRSVDVGTTPQAALRIGKNVQQANEEGESSIKNTLLMKASDGWFERQDTVTTAFGRVEGQVSTDADSSFATQVANYVFQEHREPQTTASYSFLATSDILPFQQVFVGDFVMAPSTGGTDAKRRIYSLSLAEDAAGNTLYAAEFDTIIKERIERLEKMIDNISNGTSSSLLGTTDNVVGIRSSGSSGVPLGGGSGSSGGGGGGTVTPPSAPAGLAGDAVGYFRSNGLPASRLRLRWSAVTTDTSSNAITVDHYDIWARRNRTLGQRTTTNLHTNPSFESSVADAAGTGATATQSTTWAQFGTRSLKITPSSASTSSYADLGNGSGGLRSGMAAGNWYSVSAYLRPSAVMAGSLDPNARRLLVMYRDSGGILRQYTSQPAANVSGQVTRVTATVYIPAGATEAWIRVVNGTGTGNTVDLYVDGVQVTLGTTLAQYIDGSLTSDAERTYAWTGTANASTSTLVVTDANILVGSVQNNAVSISDLDPGDSWTIGVAAVLTATSSHSAEINLTTPLPDTRLGQPTDPLVTSAFGFVSVHWDGQLSGTTPDSTFAYVYAAIGSFIGDNFVAVGQSLNQAGDIIIPNLTAGDVKYFQLQGVDKAGNVGPISTPVPVTVAAGAGGTGTTPPLPVGAIVPYGGGSAPSGWLLADGSAVSRSTYSDLFGVIGTTYGVGDGSTTFNLPNMLGRVPVGKDATQTEFAALGQTGGEKTHVLTTTEMPSHSHGPGAGTNFTVYGGGGSQVATAGTTLGLTTSTAAAGGGGAHNNLQPYETVNYIVRYAVALDTGGTSGRISWGTIEPYYSNGQPRVTFDGDTGLSGPYPWLPPYIPVAGDRVALAKDPSGSYVILGKAQSQVTFSNRIPLTLGTGYGQYATNWNNATFSKSEHGLVVLEGLVTKSGAASGDVVGVLPPGFRPDYDIIRSVYCYTGSLTDAGRTLIIKASTGEIILGPGITGTMSFLSLTNVYFFAAGSVTWKVVGVDSGYSFGAGYSSYTDGSGYNYGPVRMYQEPVSGVVFVDGVITKTSSVVNAETMVSYPSALAPDFMHILPAITGVNGNVLGEWRTSKTPTATLTATTIGNNIRFPLHSWWRPATAATFLTNISDANSWVNYDATNYPPLSWLRMGSVTLVRGLRKSGTINAPMTGALVAAGTTIPDTSPAGNGALYLAIASDAYARMDHRPASQSSVFTPQYGSNSWFSLDGTVFSPIA